MNYLKRLIIFTFRKSVVRTDRASILIGPAVTAYFSLTSSRMPEGVDGLIAAMILSTAGGALLFRLLAAPYFIWREDQVHIAEMEAELASEERRQLDVYRKTLDEKRIAFLEFLANHQQNKRSPWLINGAPFAPLLATEPGFQYAIDIWAAASKDGEPLTNQRDTWVFYQRVTPEVKASVLDISLQRANLAIETLFATLTGQHRLVAGKLETIVSQTEERLQKDRQTMLEQLAQPLSPPNIE